MIRAAAYARYSSDNQCDESIDAQLRAIHKFADENGYKIVSEYIDRAKTGTNDRREEFQRMIRDSDDGDFEVVIVHKLDRFARKRYDSAIYRKTLEENGVKLVSVLEQFTDSPEGIIFVGMFTDSPDVIAAGETALRIISAGFIASSVSVTASGSLEGLGKGVPSLIISLCRFIVVIIPAAFLLSRAFEANGVWNAFWVTELITAVISLFIYRKSVKLPSEAKK